MSAVVSCKVHGEQAEAFVCSHILDGARNGTTTEFHWSAGEDGVLNAVCAECGELSDDAWDAVSEDVWRLVCARCFEAIALKNGVTSLEVH